MIFSHEEESPPESTQMNGQILKLTDGAKYLEITLDLKLTFNKHVASTII